MLLEFKTPIHDYLPQFQSAQEILNLAFHPEKSMAGWEGWGQGVVPRAA